MIRFFTLSSAAAVIAASASASIVLSDGNSSATFEDDAPGVRQVEWTVDGQSQLALQDFYVRTNGGSVVAISSFEEVGTIQTGSDSLAVRYTEASLGLQIDITYALSGSSAGSGLSDLEITIAIDNISGEPLELEFYQLTNFDLGGSAQDASAQVQTAVAQGGTVIANTVQQRDLGIVVSETVTAPNPDGFQVGSFSDVLGAVTDGNLDGTANAGPGDLGWAFRWDATLENNRSFTIVKDLRLQIPAPAAAPVLLAGLALSRRRR